VEPAVIFDLGFGIFDFGFLECSAFRNPQSSICNLQSLAPSGPQVDRA
jgi:hypothetical protein